MLVLISICVQLTTLVNLITIASVFNLTAALVPTIPNWTINFIQTILIEIISIIPNLINTMPTIISSIKTISSIPFMLRPSKTDVGVFILILLMWIYHLIFSICVISIIFNTRNCRINFTTVDFDTAYPFFWF